MNKIYFSRIVAFVCLAIVLITTFRQPNLFAQSKPEKPNPSRIVDRASEAMGGREKFDAIFSKQIFGTVTRKSDGAVGTIEILTRRPDAYFMRLSFGDQFEQVGFNGLSGYRWSSGEDVYFLPDEDLKYLSSEAFYRNGVWHNNRTDASSKKSTVGWALLTGGLSLLFKYDPGKYKGEGVVAGKPVKNVGFDLYSGGYTLLSFDDETGYLVGEKFNITKNLEYENSDFRPVNGILMPYSIKYSVPNKAEYDIKVDRIIVNEAIETTKFEAPVSSSERLPNLTSIIEQATKNQEKYARNYDKFKYLTTMSFQQTSSSTDSMGMSTESTHTVTNKYDVSFYRGFPVEIKTKANGKPDTEKSDEEKRRKERKKIDEKFSEAQAKGQTISPLEGREEMKMRSGLVILDCLTNSIFSNYRKTNGGDLYLVDFAPKPGPGRERFAGRLWIDSKAGWVTRAEIKSATSMIKNTAQKVYSLGDPHSQILLQQPICKDLWLVTVRTFIGSEAEIVYRSFRLADDMPVCDIDHNSKLK